MQTPEKLPTRRWTLLVTGVGALLLAISASAQTAPSSAAAPNEASLLAAEDALFAADVNHNVAAITRGFADEAIFVHANGTKQTKTEYLRAAENPAFRIRGITTQDRIVRIFGNVGVVRGTKNLAVGDMHLSGSYLTVYLWRDGRWQMLDEQSAPAPKTPEGR